MSAITPSPRFTDRETARKTLTAKVVDYTRAVSDPKHFSTTDPQFILDDAVWRLRWIDCAPNGANHLTAPLQDKTGTPTGSVFSENFGPCQNLRNARIKRGLHPFLQPNPSATKDCLNRCAHL